MISAKIVADSISQDKVRITTFELVYPRFVHSELMTHRMFSRNAASSRAIPIDSVIQNILDDTATPVHWGANQSGMQAKAEVQDKTAALQAWCNARNSAVIHARYLQEVGLHKQIINRVLEPFQCIKTLVTATEWNNWFWLRHHEDAQPEICELATIMYHAHDNNQPVCLENKQWHMPYLDSDFRANGEQYFLDEEGNEITLNKALMISSSCCAQISYRKNDPSLDKAEVIYKRLIESEPCHASPTEHQAVAMSLYADFRMKYVTHVDKRGCAWSGNFKGWGQHRQGIPNNYKWG